jgi:hypothetical protein
MQAQTELLLKYCRRNNQLTPKHLGTTSRATGSGAMILLSSKRPGYLGSAPSVGDRQLQGRCIFFLDHHLVWLGDHFLES